MAAITLDGNPVHTCGDIPKTGSQAIDFELVATNLSTKTLVDFIGNNLILNIFPSVGTGICAASVRAFNISAAKFKDTKVLCISRDLPFAQHQFCGAEGIENVIMLSDFKNGVFGKNYGLLMTNGIFDGLLSRCVFVINKKGTIIYTEQVPDIGQEPNYQAALESIANA